MDILPGRNWDSARAGFGNRSLASTAFERPVLVALVVAAVIAVIVVRIDLNLSHCGTGCAVALVESRRRLVPDRSIFFTIYS